MRDHRSLKGFPMAAMAAAGVILGHWLAYRVALPQPAARAAVLAGSGHSYLFAAARLAVVMALSALGTVAARHWRSGGRDTATRGAAFSRLVLHLTLLQVVAFTGMEVLERWSVGAPVAAMFAHHLFFLGLAVQFLVAAAAAAVLVWFGRVAARVVRSLRPVRALRARPPQIRVRPAPMRLTPLLGGAAGVRGPPSH